MAGTEELICRVEVCIKYDRITVKFKLGTYGYFIFGEFYHKGVRLSGIYCILSWGVVELFCDDRGNYSKLGLYKEVDKIMDVMCR